MRYVNSCTHLFVIVLLLMGLGCGSSGNEGKVSQQFDPEKEPVRIGVCVLNAGRFAEYTRCQWDGIRTAHQTKPVFGDRKIELILKTPDEGSLDFSDLITSLIERETLDGVIVSYRPLGVGGDRGGRGEDNFTLAIVPAMAEMGKNKEKRMIKLGSALEDQARVAALFAVDKMNALKAGVILDQGSADSVKLASFFSSEMIRLGGVITKIAYVTEGKDVSVSLIKALIMSDPDVIYMPYSEKISKGVIDLLKDHDNTAAVIVSNIVLEKMFLDTYARSFKGAYLITDFHPRAVQSRRAAEFLDVYRKTRDVSSIETCAAMGAEAYLLLIDILEQMETGKNLDESLDSLVWEGSISGIIGKGSSIRLPKYMYVSRIQKGIFRGPWLAYVASVNPHTKSDSVIDIGTE